MNGERWLAVLLSIVLGKMPLTSEGVMAALKTTTGSFPGATRITTDRYHAMIARGILEEGAPVELLDGFLVMKDRSKRGGKTR